MAIAPETLQHWLREAVACRARNDTPGEEAAIQRALSLDPMDLLALILRADLLERQGKRHEAASAYSAVLAVAPPRERVHPDLHPALDRAAAFRESYGKEFAAFLDGFLAPQLARHEGERVDRFRSALDMMVGRRKRYESHSAIFHYPHLPAIEFFDHGDFPWLAAVEAATDEIRGEFIRVLESEEGFTPYITYPPDVPHNQWAQLNNSPAWSAFHLFKMGERIEANAAKCPATMNVLAGVPQPDMPGRTPSAMFSLLKPHTHIPPQRRSVLDWSSTCRSSCLRGADFALATRAREWVPERHGCSTTRWSTRRGTTVTSCAWCSSSTSGTRT